MSVFAGQLHIIHLKYSQHPENGADRFRKTSFYAIFKTKKPIAVLLISLELKILGNYRMEMFFQMAHPPIVTHSHMFPSPLHSVFLVSQGLGIDFHLFLSHFCRLTLT